MEEGVPDRHGRTQEEWVRLTREGLRFLVERARLGQLTTYTEMNTVLHNRTGIRAFDFEQAGERAAMGELLGRINDLERPESGHMISALVRYLDENDAGPGFYRLAQEYGMLPATASAEEKLVFWATEVHAVYAHYRR
jgi:hypothetical protein